MKQIIAFSILILLGCQHTRKKIYPEFVNGKQVLSMNMVDEYGKPINADSLKTIKPGSIFIGQQALFRLYNTNTSSKIVKAYFDCECDSNTLIDTVTYEVSGCKKGLLVENDSIVVAFKPAEIGKKAFHEITAVTKDGNSNLRYLKGTFEYTVKTK